MKGKRGGVRQKSRDAWSGQGKEQARGSTFQSSTQGDFEKLWGVDSRVGNGNQIHDCQIQEVGG